MHMEDSSDFERLQPVEEYSVKEGSFGIGSYVVNWVRSPIPFSTTHLYVDDAGEKHVHRIVSVISFDYVVSSGSKIPRLIFFGTHLTFLKTKNRVWGRVKRERHYG